MWLLRASWAIFTPRGLHPRNLLPLPERNPPFSGYLLWRLPRHARLQAPAMGMLPTEEEITPLLAKMRKKQMLLKSLGKNPMMRQQKPLRLQTKRKLHLIENTESNLNYGFVATGDSHSPTLLCIICGDWLHNKALKP